MSKGGGWTGPLNRWGLSVVVPPLIFFVGEALLFKHAQLGVLSSGAGVIDVLQSWLPDLQAGLFLVVVFGAAISSSRKGVSIGGIVLFVLLLVPTLILLAASHAYFKSTGSHLSAAAIYYWLENPGDTNKVIAGDALTWRLPLVLGQIGVVAILLGAVALPRARKKIQAAAPLSRRLSLAVLLGSAIVAGALFIVPPLSGPGMALSRCVPLSIAIDLATGMSRAEEEDSTTDAPVASLQDRTEILLEAQEGAPRPNVVFIIFESLNWKNSDAYVPGIGTTPFLEKLAQKSLLIDRQYTIVPHTSKAIVPLLCGIESYPRTKNKESVRGILPRKCMAHILASQGYRTAFFQPAMDFEERSQLVRNMGFDTFRGKDDMPGRGFEEISYFGREDKMMLEPSLDWIRAVGDKPFFATYLTLSSHHNYVTPQSFARVEYPVEDDDLDNFLNAVRYVDSFIEELFERLEAEGMMDNTVVIISGDHGEAFAEHGRRQHDLVMWEEGLRVASLIYSPALFPEPGVIEGVRSHLDFVPTVADILGLEPVGESFAGSSLLEPAPANRQLFYSCYFNRQCLATRIGDVKTIYHYDLQPMEVYDNSVDPFDERDLAGTDGFDEQFLNDRKREMIRWQKALESKYSSWSKALAHEIAGEGEPPIGRRLAAGFGDSIEIVGADVNPLKVTAGEDVHLRYVFKCNKKLTRTTKLFVHVLSKGKGGYVNADHIPSNGTKPLRKWKPGTYVVDEHTVHIPANWAGRKARVLIGFWDEKSGDRFNITGKNITVSEKRLQVASLEVGGEKLKSNVTREEMRKKADAWIRDEEPEFTKGMNVIFGEKVELIGVSLDRVDVKLAGTVEMEYVFRALVDKPGALKLTVKLEREGGDEVVDGNHVPIGGLHPVQSWIANEYVVDRQMIHIDMYKIKTGVYNVWLGFRDGDKSVPAEGGAGDVLIDQKNRVLLGKVTISPKTEKQ